uniref:SFRICE_010440 n=1 Tax=Spodoptera frugiperda TaxID=7108 RepID=A0A2H1V5L6_SPOFR
MAILDTLQLTNQVEKLAQVSRDLRRKHKQIQNQMRLVCEERSELTAIVQSQQRDIAALQQDSAQNKKCPTCGVATPDGGDDDDQSSKPTFSVRELRAILHERNELKLKLSRAEEQLSALQADQQHDSGSDTSPSVSTAHPEEEEPPVQGPLPAEPDDAPWKRNSGIRKFFRKLFVESDLTVGGFQRRSLSTLRGGAGGPSPAPPAHPADVRNPPVSKLDLRQELLNLNLGTQEFHSWIGDKFDEAEEYENVFYDDRFEHDIPLQRSISLDRGIDIFNHLQAIGSVSSGSDGSLWSVDSEGRDSVTDRYRSFEDIPTSPYRARSRRASFGVETFSERDLALAVLSESYKNIGATSGSVSPQIRKLQRCFTFSGTFDSIKDRTSVENLPEASERPKLKLLIPKREDSTSCPVSPEISRLKNFFNKSADDVETKMSDDEDQEFEARKPVYRSISVEFNQGEGSAVRQRRSGLQDIMMRDLRRQVLVKQEFRSSENLRNQSPQLGGPSKNPHKMTDQNSNTKSNFLSLPGNTDGYVTVPTIVISDADSHGVAKISDTSNYVGISRNCDCRICTEGEGKYFVRSVLSKLFVKIVSCNVRKLYWDENNNLNENEMYKCIMHVLKLMLGLWLRHLDHNQ